MVEIRGHTSKAQLDDFERQMLDLGSKRIPRAVQFALNGVAMEATKKSRPMLARELNNPTPWAIRAFYAKRGKLSEAPSDLSEISSEMAVKDQQSVPFKYILSDGEERRTPGDVGPAEEHILLPWWPGLFRYMGIRKTSRGDLPRTALDKIWASRDTFFGAPFIFGRSLPLGIYRRPKRRISERTGLKINAGIPALLMVAEDQTRHQPILTKPTEKVAIEAMKTFPTLLEDQIRTEIGKMGAKAAGLGKGSRS